MNSFNKYKSDTDIKNLPFLVVKFLKFSHFAQILLFFEKIFLWLLDSTSHTNKIKNKTPVFSFLWNVNKWWLWRAYRTNSKSRRTAKNISSKLIIFTTYNFVFHLYSLIPTQTCYLNKLWYIVSKHWMYEFHTLW